MVVEVAVTVGAVRAAAVAVGVTAIRVAIEVERWWPWWWSG